MLCKQYNTNSNSQGAGLGATAHYHHELQNFLAKKVLAKTLPTLSAVQPFCPPFYFL
jgi:hypothetical protein